MSNFVKRVEAIKVLYPNVVSNLNNQAFDDNGNEVVLDETAITSKITELETADATNKVSGNQKLLDLGLSQAEATALTGYTPPSED